MLWSVHCVFYIFCDALELRQKVFLFYVGIVECGFTLTHMVTHSHTMGQTQTQYLLLTDTNTRSLSVSLDGSPFERYVQIL